MTYWFVDRAQIQRSAALGSLFACFGTTCAFAQTGVTQGDILVYRVGTGTAALSSVATQVYLDEYSTSGTLVQSIMVDSTVAASGNTSLTASGTATSEGGLTLSGNGQYVALTGYDANLGTVGIASTASTVDPRTVGILNLSTGIVNTSTALTNVDSGNNIRDAYTTDGTSIWTAGTAGTGATATGGINYTTIGSTTATNVESTASNERRVSVYNGQLYANGAATGDQNVATVGTGTPTSGPQTVTVLTGLPITGTSGYDFLFSNPTTLYVADSTNGIEKYTFSSSSNSWGLAYASTSAGSLYGLTAGSTAGTFYGSTPTAIESIVDTGSGFTTTSIVTAATNEAFRGLIFDGGFTSSATPEPGAATLLGLGGLTLIGFAKRRRSH